MTCTPISRQAAPCCTCGKYGEPVHVVEGPAGTKFYCATCCPPCAIARCAAEQSAAAEELRRNPGDKNARSFGRAIGFTRKRFYGAKTMPENEQKSTRITVDEIATDLGIGVLAVRKMLEDGIIPAIKLGRRWIVTRHVYREWVRTCGQIRVA